MTYTDAAKRASATFVQAALAIVVAAGLTGSTGDLSTLKQAFLAGLVAVATLGHRITQAWLEVHQ